MTYPYERALFCFVLVVLVASYFIIRQYRRAPINPEIVERRKRLGI